MGLLRLFGEGDLGVEESGRWCGEEGRFPLGGFAGKSSFEIGLNKR